MDEIVTIGCVGHVMRIAPKLVRHMRYAVNMKIGCDNSPQADSRRLGDVLKYERCRFTRIQAIDSSSRA